MSVPNYGAISVGAAAAVIVPANTARRKVQIVNIHATQILYVGYDASVTTSNGYPLAPNDAGDQSEITLEGTGVAVYGIGSGAATTGRYIETGV